MSRPIQAGLGATIILMSLAALFPLKAYFNLATIALLLMLVVVACAVKLGRAAAFAAAVIASLGLNLLFIPPFGTFSIAAPENWVAFFVFVAMAMFVAQLASRAREQQQRAECQRAEAQRLYAELQQAIQTNAAHEAEIQAEKIKSAFLDAVTHDLRTPLTSIKAAASSLLHEPWPPQDRLAAERVREMLTVIVEESDRLNRFIENMIELARRKHGDAMRLVDTSIHELVDTALERASIRLRDRRVQLHISEGLPPVSADREAVSEVLYTLLDNAAKYSSTYSRIDVRAVQTDEGIAISVEDEGRGIPAELWDRVFEKFARASASEQGFGMGLAIAKAIIEAHGGRIWIDGRRNGRGVIVTFLLRTKPAAVLT